MSPPVLHQVTVGATPGDAITDQAVVLRRWLRDQVLPPLASLRGVGGVHLFEGAVAAPMTNEQRIRGADAGFDWAVLATGYDEEALAALTEDGLSRAKLETHGATGVRDAAYRLHYALTASDAAT